MLGFSVLFVIAPRFMIIWLPAIEAAETARGEGSRASSGSIDEVRRVASRTSWLCTGNLVLGAVAIFVYVGGGGDWQLW